MVAYLLEKETITGGEMVAIIEGRDPALVEDAYTSTRKQEQPSFRPSQPDHIEPPARHIHMISEEIKAPSLEEDAQSQEDETAEKSSQESEASEQPSDSVPSQDTSSEADSASPTPVSYTHLHPCSPRSHRAWR